MRCEHCHFENPEDVEMCANCGEKFPKNKKQWHSLHNLLWGNKINQDILETLNELNNDDSNHFIHVARKLKKHED